MSYHMSRVAHWAQNKHVGFYATQDLRQLNYPPLSEYFIFHFQVLGAGDRWANLVQTFSLFGCLVCVSLLVKSFGAGSRAQITAAVLVATLPIAILEGSSAQNDLFACFWVASGAYFLSRHQKSGKRLHLLCAGIAVGLAWLSKGAAYVYVTPFLLSYAVVSLGQRRLTALKRTLAVVMIALSLNSIHYLKNYQLCQSPLSCEELVDLTFNDGMTPALLASNVVRSLALNLATPFGPVNAAIATAVEKIHGWLALSTDDARTTYALETFRIGRHMFHEDYAANPLHALLALVLLPLLFIGRLPSELKLFTLNAVFAALLLALLLKWNPWLVRFHLTIFILLSVPLAVLMSSWKNGRPAQALIVILLLAGTGWLFNNHAKPVFAAKNIFNTPRFDQYFAARPTHKDSYAQTARYLKESGCSHVGLRLNPFAWEYPLWAYLGFSTLRLEAVDVINASKIYADGGFSPCLIVDNLPHEKANIRVGNDRYGLVERFETMKIYAPSRRQTAPIDGAAVP
jgi:hypothetical protein